MRIHSCLDAALKSSSAAGAACPGPLPVHETPVSFVVSLKHASTRNLLHLQSKLLEGLAVDCVCSLRCQQQRLCLQQRTALPALLPLIASQLHLWGVQQSLYSLSFQYLSTST